MLWEIEQSIRRTKYNKATPIDRLNNEMFKLEPRLMAEVLLELWRLIGTSKIYPQEWKKGVWTPVYRKGDDSLAQNYRPLCMISCARKVIEAVIAREVAKNVSIYARQYGFKARISTILTLIVVNTLVKADVNKIATLDLTKAYDKVNRAMLWENCKKKMTLNLLSMIPVFI